MDLIAALLAGIMLFSVFWIARKTTGNAIDAMKFFAIIVVVLFLMITGIFIVIGG